MSRDNPPQTVAEALEWGWIALAFTCAHRSCGHEGRVDLAGLPEWSHRRSLAAVFARCVCSRCGTHPTTAKLASRDSGSDAPEVWFEKRVDFFEDKVLRPTRD